MCDWSSIMKFLPNWLSKIHATRLVVATQHTEALIILTTCYRLKKICQYLWPVQEFSLIKLYNYFSLKFVFILCAVVACPGGTNDRVCVMVHGLGSTPNLVGFLCVRIISSICSEVNSSDWQEGSTVSSVICDHWWHLQLVVIRGWSCQGQHCMAESPV